MNSNQFEGGNKSVIIILERKEDPVTPLLS